MRMRTIRDVPVPDGISIQVFCWRWPAHYGEGPSKKLFELLKSTESKKNSGLGAYRSREMNPTTGGMGDWYVWAVDVDYDLMGTVRELRNLDSRLVEPEPENATRLVLRHLSTLVTDGTEREQVAHYGAFGAILDAAGGMHIRAGEG